MERNCNNCLYILVAEDEEPCCRCKRTAIDGSPAYNTRPDLWTAEECDSKAEMVSDFVNHPSHYNKGKIEVADFIADQKLNFDRGNAVKYVCRAGSKDPDKEIQDLEKAIWYINHEIKMLKGDIENDTRKENA